MIKLVFVTLIPLLTLANCVPSADELSRRTTQRTINSLNQFAEADRKRAAQVTRVQQGKTSRFNDELKTAKIACEPELGVGRHEQYALCVGAADSEITRRYFPRNRNVIASRSDGVELRIRLYEKVDQGEITKVEDDRLFQIGWNRILAKYQS